MSYKLVVEYNAETQEKVIMTIDEESVPSDFYIWSWDSIDQCPIYAPANIQPPQNKFDRHGNHKRKVEFETQLALAVLENAQLFLPVLHRMGNTMKMLIELDEQVRIGSEKKRFIDKVGRAFRHELYPSEKLYFGRLGYRDQAPRIDKIYASALKMLTSEKKIEHLFSLYTILFDVFAVLSTERAKNYYACMRELRDTSYHSEIFYNRGRVMDANKRVLSTRFGIDDENAKLFPNIIPHFRPIEYTERDSERVSSFAIEAYAKEIPFVCGPSAHAAKVFATLMPFCLDLSQDEKQEIALCCAAFLIAAGAHSFHEVFSVAKLFQMQYEAGNYASALPLSFKGSAVYQSLMNDFPDVIPKEQFESKLVVSESLLQTTAHLTQFFASQPLKSTLAAENKKFAGETENNSFDLKAENNKLELATENNEMKISNFFPLEHAKISQSIDKALQHKRKAVKLSIILPDMCNSPKLSYGALKKSKLSTDETPDNDESKDQIMSGFKLGS